MTQGDYIRLVAQIAVLKEIAMEYPGKTIDNIIVQMEARKKASKRVEEPPNETFRNITSAVSV